jgi:hypothetical protein
LAEKGWGDQWSGVRASRRDWGRGDLSGFSDSMSISGQVLRSEQDSACYRGNASILLLNMVYKFKGYQFGVYCTLSTPVRLEDHHCRFIFSRELPANIRPPFLAGLISAILLHSFSGSWPNSAEGACTSRLQMIEMLRALARHHSLSTEKTVLRCHTHCAISPFVISSSFQPLASPPLAQLDAT